MTNIGTVTHESEQPTVSVIVIFLNAAAFLAEAIESVRRQTLPNWELVFVDDGSTDESSAIARTICARDPGRHRYLEHPHHDNRGMSASRNLGLAAARGRYIAFLDADDVFLPTRLEAHVRILDAMPLVDMVQSDHLWWHDWQPVGQRFDEDHRRPCAWDEDGVVTPPEALMTIFAAPLLSTATCSITIRRSAALELGGFEESFRSLYEDQVFLTKVYLERMIYVMRACLSKVRVHGSSCTNALAASAHRPTGTWQLQTKALIAWQVRYIRDRGSSDPFLELQLRERARSLRWLRYQGLAITMRAYAYGLLQKLLPHERYIDFMRWRRHELERRTWRQYRRFQALRGSTSAQPLHRRPEGRHQPVP